MKLLTIFRIIENIPKTSWSSKKSLTKIQVQENTAIIAKFAARLLILIILIGVIIYSLPS